nr:MAG TPA: hypothetical protein [Caudoviricetes sp.]
MICRSDKGFLGCLKNSTPIFYFYCTSAYYSMID